MLANGSEVIWFCVEKALKATVNCKYSMGLQLVQKVLFHRPLGCTAAAMMLSENILKNFWNKLLPQTVYGSTDE